MAIDDATSGNGNGVINRNECVNLNVALKNNGCANATAISATLTTTTPGVTVTQGSSTYPNMAIDATGTNSTPFQIQTSNHFACGTEIDFDLNLTFPNGSKTIHITVPTCTGGADQTIPPSTLTASDLTQADRLGRDGQPSRCDGKACPGGIGHPGTRFFKTFGPFTNSAECRLLYCHNQRGTRVFLALAILKARHIWALRSNKPVPELSGRQRSIRFGRSWTGTRAWNRFLLLYRSGRRELCRGREYYWHD